MESKNKLTDNLPYIGMLAAICFFIYRDYWFLKKIFTGADFFRAYVPLFNFQADCLREFSWPLWNPYMNFGYPWVDHYLNSFLFPTHLIMGVLTIYTLEVAQIEVLGWILLGGIGIYLCVIEYGLSRKAALISAVSFMFSGQLIALPAWADNLFNACCFPFILLGYHRAEKSNNPLSLISVFFLAISVYGGHLPATVLGIYFFSGYVLFDSLSRKRVLSGIKYLSVTLVSSILLALPKILPFYLSLKNSPRTVLDAATPTFYGFVSWYEFMSFILPVKYYFSLYIGIAGVLALIYAIIRGKIRLNPLMLMFFLSMLLLLSDMNGNILFPRSAVNNLLPFMKLIRYEFLFWFYPLIFAILYLSRYLDDFLNEKGIKVKMVATVLFSFVLSFLFFREYNISIFYKTYIIQIGLSFLWLLAAILHKRERAQILLIVILLTGDFSLFFSRVNIDEPPVRDGKFMEVTLTHQNYTSRSVRDGELVKEKLRVRIIDDRLRPSVSESRKQPYLTIGEKGALNTADSMNQKLFSGDWYNPQQKFDFIALKETPYFQTLEGHPLFSLLSLRSGKNAGSAGIDKISCSSFDFSVKLEEEGVLILNQMYDDRWIAFVDGKKQKPVRMGVFMAVQLGAEAKKVEFIFRDKVFYLSLAVSAITIMGLLFMRFRVRFQQPKT